MIAKSKEMLGEGGIRGRKRVKAKGRESLVDLRINAHTDPSACQQGGAFPPYSDYYSTPGAGGGNQLALTAVQSTSCWTASFRTAGCMADIQLSLNTLRKK